MTEDQPGNQDSGWGAPLSDPSPDQPGGDQPPQPGWQQEPTPPPPPPGGWNQPPQPGWQQQPPPGQGGWNQPPPPGQGGWNQPPPPGWQPQQPGGWQQQGAWGAPPPYYPARQTESTAIVALVLAIVSFVACPLIPAIPAVIVGRSAQKKIEDSNGMLEGEGLAKAGWIIGTVNIVLCSLFILLVIIVAIADSGSSTY